MSNIQFCINGCYTSTYSDMQHKHFHLSLCPSEVLIMSVHNYMHCVKIYAMEVWHHNLMEEAKNTKEVKSAEVEAMLHFISQCGL